jgi:hypothetical protein
MCELEVVQSCWSNKITNRVKITETEICNVASIAFALSVWWSKSKM